MWRSRTRWDRRRRAARSGRRSAEILLAAGQRVPQAKRHGRALLHRALPARRSLFLVLEEKSGPLPALLLAGNDNAANVAGRLRANGHGLEEHRKAPPVKRKTGQTRCRLSFFALTRSERHEHRTLFPASGREAKLRYGDADYQVLHPAISCVARSPASRSGSRSCATGASSARRPMPRPTSPFRRHLEIVG